MSTHFFGEGNIGSAPEYREIANGNEEPRRLLRLNVYFDNPVPSKDGYDDRGGFWAPVEVWNREADHWLWLFQKGMRVLVDGRMVRDEWTDADNNERVTMKIEARRVAMLPYRIESVMLTSKPSTPEAPHSTGQASLIDATAVKSSHAADEATAPEGDAQPATAGRQRKRS